MNMNYNIKTNILFIITTINPKFSKKNIYFYVLPKINK